MNLLDYFRKRLLMKSCASYRSTSEYVSWQDARSVLLLYDSDMDERNSDLRFAIDRIEADGKHVTECFFVDKKKAVTSSISDRVVIDRKGVDFLGRPSGVAVRQLMDEGTFDVAINLSGNDVMTYVAMGVRARLKCSRQSGTSVFDFQIEGSELTQLQLLDETVRYLSMIKK